MLSRCQTRRDMRRRAVQRCTCTASPGSQTHSATSLNTKMFYKLTCTHQTLKVMPAMAAGVTDKLWDVLDFERGGLPQRKPDCWDDQNAEHSDRQSKPAGLLPTFDLMGASSRSAIEPSSKTREPLSVKATQRHVHEPNLSNGR